MTGHSLGAGTATLLAFLWQRGGALRGMALGSGTASGTTGSGMPSEIRPSIEGRISCVAFATPQTMDKASAHGQIATTTSVIVGDDLVPRFSLRSTLDLHRRAMRLGALNEEQSSDPDYSRFIAESAVEGGVYVVRISMLCPVWEWKSWTGGCCNELRRVGCLSTSWVSTRWRGGRRSEFRSHRHSPHMALCSGGNISTEDVSPLRPPGRLVHLNPVGELSTAVLQTGEVFGDIRISSTMLTDHMWPGMLRALGERI